MKRTFVIFEIDSIVSMDLAGALKEEFPNADVVEARTVDDLLILAQSNRDEACLLINSELLTESIVAPLHTIVARGGRIVVIGTDKSTDPSMRVLEKPFTNTMILDAVKTGGPERCGCQ